MSDGHRKILRAFLSGGECTVCTCADGPVGRFCQPQHLFLLPQSVWPASGPLTLRFRERSGKTAFVSSEEAEGRKAVARE